MTDEQVLEMPVARFWLMHGNINRIKAENDLRLSSLIVSSQAGSGEALSDYRRDLLSEMGRVAVVSERLDRGGLNRLKAKFAR